MSSNPFLVREARVKNLTPSHRRAKKQEKELAKRVGGALTPASGARHQKGDVRKKGVLRIEAKTTKHSSFSVTLEMLEKIETASSLGGELPVIIIEFNDGNGRKLKEVAVCPTYVIDELAGGE